MNTKMIERKETVYLVGRIAGDINHRAKFDKAAQELEEKGYVVVNPAMIVELSMKRELLNKCGAICMLPGWGYDEGARAERLRAVTTGKKVSFLDELLEEVVDP